MKRLMYFVVISLLLSLLVSCGGIKRSMQAKAASVLEEQAKEMGLDVDIDAEMFKDGIAEGLAGEAMEEILETGAESLGKQLDEAFSDEILQEMGESMDALDAAVERDAEGNITNIRIDGENSVINLDGSTEWPSEMPGKIPRYEDGMLFTYQIEEDEMISLVFGGNSLDYAKEYTQQLKRVFTPVYEVSEEGWIFVGTSDSDGVVLAYNDGGVVLQYYMGTDFADNWQSPE